MYLCGCSAGGESGLHRGLRRPSVLVPSSSQPSAGPSLSERCPVATLAVVTGHCAGGRCRNDRLISVHGRTKQEALEPCFVGFFFAFAPLRACLSFCSDAICHACTRTHSPSVFCHFAVSFCVGHRTPRLLLPFSACPPSGSPDDMTISPLSKLNIIRQQCCRVS